MTQSTCTADHSLIIHLTNGNAHIVCIVCSCSISSSPSAAPCCCWCAVCWLRGVCHLRYRSAVLSLTGCPGRPRRSCCSTPAPPCASVAHSEGGGPTVERTSNHQPTHPNTHTPTAIACPCTQHLSHFLTLTLPRLLATCSPRSAGESRRRWRPARHSAHARQPPVISLPSAPLCVRLLCVMRIACSRSVPPPPCPGAAMRSRRLRPWRGCASAVRAAAARGCRPPSARQCTVPSSSSR